MTAAPSTSLSRTSSATATAHPGNASAHTIEFSLRATPSGLVSPLGWSVTFTRAGIPVAGASITGGAYNADVAVAGLPAAGGPITVTVTDRSDPACTPSSPSVPEPPSIVGTVNVGAGADRPLLATAPRTGGPPSPAAWK